ncbi:MAG: SpoIIE family protein phosphatase [Schwartzia sp.]|nr:SpoIIE family protein phosphatase [Schwartzia sp. (in: firmicutes)]
MEIKIGIAGITKSGAEYCGDSHSLVERGGGMTMILSDGHGNTAAAQQTSRWVTQRARSLVLEGKENDTVARTVHEELYEMKDRKVACALTIFGVDAESESVAIGRSGQTPVYVWTEEYETVYDDEATALGMSRSVNPQTYDLPLAQGMILVAVSEGVRMAGKKRGGAHFEEEKLWEIVRGNPARDADFIAKNILEYALALDQDMPAEDMTVAVLGVAPDKAENAGVGFLSASYPISVMEE